MKKTLCAAMALTLTMATAAPAFAADTNSLDNNANISLTQNNDNIISPRLVINWRASGSGSRVFYRNGNQYEVNFSLNLTGTVNDGTFSFSTLGKPTITSWSTDYKSGVVSDIELGNINPEYTNGRKNATFKSILYFKVDGKAEMRNVTITAYGGSNTLTIP